MTIIHHVQRTRRNGLTRMIGFVRGTFVVDEEGIRGVITRMHFDRIARGMVTGEEADEQAV